MWFGINFIQKKTRKWPQVAESGQLLFLNKIYLECALICWNDFHLLGQHTKCFWGPASASPSAPKGSPTDYSSSWLSATECKTLMSHSALQNKYTFQTQSVICVFFSQLHLIREKNALFRTQHTIEKQVFPSCLTWLSGKSRKEHSGFLNSPTPLSLSLHT